MHPLLCFTQSADPEVVQHKKKKKKKAKSTEADHSLAPPHTHVLAICTSFQRCQKYFLSGVQVCMIGYAPSRMRTFKFHGSLHFFALLHHPLCAITPSRAGLIDCRAASKNAALTIPFCFTMPKRQPLFAVAALANPTDLFLCVCMCVRVCLTCDPQASFFLSTA